MNNGLKRLVIEARRSMIRGIEDCIGSNTNDLSESSTIKDLIVYLVQENVKLQKDEEL